MGHFTWKAKATLAAAILSLGVFGLSNRVRAAEEEDVKVVICQITEDGDVYEIEVATEEECTNMGGKVVKE